MGRTHPLGSPGWFNPELSPRPVPLPGRAQRDPVRGATAPDHLDHTAPDHLDHPHINTLCHITKVSINKILTCFGPSSWGDNVPTGSWVRSSHRLGALLCSTKNPRSGPDTLAGSSPCPPLTSSYHLGQALLPLSLDSLDNNVQLS